VEEAPMRIFEFEYSVQKIRKYGEIDPDSEY
jgi:hypothetical protein